MSATVHIWRPRNETNADLARENAAREHVADCWRVDVLKLSEALYGVDWSLHRASKLVAFGEYKHRSRAFPSILLSLAKFEHGRRLARVSRVPFIFFVEFPSIGLHWVNCSALPALAIERGGNSRGQNGDDEPCVFIPFREFARVKARP